jgi:hypothetical protein
MDNLLQFSNSIIGIDIITACGRIKLSSSPASMLFSDKYLLLIIIYDLSLLLYGPFGDGGFWTENLWTN